MKGALNDHLARVRQRIVETCRRCGRDPTLLTLVAVTKGVSIETIREAISLGLSEFGENRVQEARQKQDALGSGLKAQGAGLEPRAFSLERVRWHLVGHLQRNKARQAAEVFDVIHSIDSEQLADALERHAAQRGAAGLELFVQVNLSGEQATFGCREDETQRLAQHIGKLPHLRLVGLMTIPPYLENAEATRPYFRQLRQLRDTLNAQLRLSMGMSHDVEVAIEEGADVVRIGTALFGPRAPG